MNFQYLLNLSWNSNKKNDQFNFLHDNGSQHNEYWYRWDQGLPFSDARIF